MEKSRHGLRQVGISGGISGDQSPDLRQNLLAVKPVSTPDESGRRLGELQDRNRSAWLQHAQHLAQARLIVRKIPKTKCRSYQVEGTIGKEIGRAHV